MFCCFPDVGSAGEAQCDVCTQGMSGAAGKLGSTAPLQPSSELGYDAMVTPHIVCQTPKGGADFSCSTSPILCISDLSLSTCHQVAKKPVQERQRVPMKLITF